jgi:hypothetical protein
MVLEMRPAKSAPINCPSTTAEGNNGGHESIEVEGRDEEEERARDRAQVVAVDQADDRGRDGYEHV